MILHNWISFTKCLPMYMAFDCCIWKWANIFVYIYSIYSDIFWYYLKWANKMRLLLIKILQMYRIKWLHLFSQNLCWCIIKNVLKLIHLSPFLVKLLISNTCGPDFSSAHLLVISCKFCLLKSVNCKAVLILLQRKKSLISLFRKALFYF